MSDAHSRVTISTRPLWLVRLGRESPRYLLCALSLVGIVASARYAIAPPRPTAMAGRSSQPTSPDRAAEGFASLFARRYLTWTTSEPLASQRALQPFIGPGMEAGAGLQLPSAGSQRVEWIDVVQQRDLPSRAHVYTLAVQTDTGGLQYLTVGIARAADGHLELAGYPAIVGPPANGQSQPPGRLREVADSTLTTVVERALRNYLAAAPGELAADLSARARVSIPGSPLTLVSMQRLDWSPDGTSVIAVVQARDTRGVEYTLAYELDVVPVAGRWEISAVQMDPNA